MTESSGWMEVDQPPVYTKDGRRFALILSSEGYKHVNVINRETNQRVPITSGKMVVTEIYFWDEVNHLIYFRATGPDDKPGQRHLYTVTDFESGNPGVVKCLSCDVTNTRGGDCNYNSFDFSEGIFPGFFGHPKKTQAYFQKNSLKEFCKNTQFRQLSLVFSSSLLGIVFEKK